MTSSLFGLQPEALSRTVTISGDNKFVVRGLTPVQVFSLYGRHTGELSDLFDKVMANVRDNGGAGQADIEATVVSLLREAPVLIGELIALASGADPTDRSDQVITDDAGGTATVEAFEAAVHIAQRLPFAAQVDALEKIADLTFTSEMPAGKFLTLVIDLAKKVTGAIKPSRAS